MKVTNEVSNVIANQIAGSKFKESITEGLRVYDHVPSDITPESFGFSLASANSSIPRVTVDMINLLEFIQATEAIMPGLRQTRLSNDFYAGWNAAKSFMIEKIFQSFAEQIQP